MQTTTRIYTLLFFGCLLFHLAGTWIVPLIDRDEPRFAEASREMIERNDYVIPYFNNQYRFDKPPLTYWAQVASYTIFGQNDFAARFPSAIAAALTALVICAWGRRIGDERVGLWAAIIFTLSLQTFIHAKAAVADMWLVLFVTLAHRAGYELLFGEGGSKRSTFTPEKLSGQAVQRSTLNSGGVEATVLSRDTHRVWWWVFYFALAFAFLAKGPIGWTPILTVILAVFFLRERKLARRFRLGRGMLLAFAIVCLWGIPALVRTHGEFFWIGVGRHVVGRSVSAMGGHGARSFITYALLLPFYFVTIFVSFFPWSIKLPWLAKRLRRERDPLDVYLLCGVGIVLGIFTFVTTKLLHYTLPAFPLLALLLARALNAESATAFVKRCVLVMTPVYLAIALLVSPFIGPLFPGWELFRISREDLRPEMKFGAVGYNEPSLVWYFRSRVRSYLQTSKLHPEAVQPFMEQTGARFVIVPTELAIRLYPTLPDNWKTFSTRGINAVKGKRSDLTLILKPE